LLAAASANRKGTRIESSLGEACTEQRRHGEHHDVVDQDRREAAADRDRQRQQVERAPRLARDPGGGRIVEAGRAHARGEDHQAAHQQQRREMNSARDLAGRQRTHGDHHDRRDHGDAGAVDLQAGRAPERHPQVGQRKDDRDDKCHKAPSR